MQTNLNDQVEWTFLKLDSSFKEIFGNERETLSRKPAEPKIQILGSTDKERTV
jgi:hypothetical protein